MRHHFALPLIFAAGCSPGTTIPANNSVDINAAAARAQGSVAAYAARVAQDAPAAIKTPGPSDAARPPLGPTAPPTGGSRDDHAGIPEAPFAPDSPQGAATVVQSYYALLGERNYTGARSLWEDGGKASGADPAGFAARFDRYAGYHADVGAPGDEDAGAGQRYVMVPVHVHARLRQSGQAEDRIGSVTLHRVGDVDGATVEQKSWHIRSIDLKPAPAQP